MDHQPTEAPSPTNEITDPIVASKIEVLIQQYVSILVSYTTSYRNLFPFLR